MTISMAIFAAFCLIVAVVVILLLYDIDKQSHKKSTPDDYQRSVQDAVDAAFHRRNQEHTVVYDEERRLAKWIEDQLDREDFNLSTLAEGASARTLALTIKTLEDEAALAANDLMKILAKKSHAQRSLVNHTEQQLQTLVKKEEDILRLLESQEADARSRIAKAQKNLEKLSETIKQLPVEPTPRRTSDKSSDFVEEHWG